MYLAFDRVKDVIKSRLYLFIYKPRKAIELLPDIVYLPQDGKRDGSLLVPERIAKNFKLKPGDCVEVVLQRAKQRGANP